MNNLPSHTSFQGILDSIIRSYLVNELSPECARNPYHGIPERDLENGNRGNGIHYDTTGNFIGPITHSPNNPTGTIPGPSIDGKPTIPLPPKPSASLLEAGKGNIDQEYIKALYQW